MNSPNMSLWADYNQVEPMAKTPSFIYPPGARSGLGVLERYEESQETAKKPTVILLISFFLRPVLFGRSDCSI